MFLASAWYGLGGCRFNSCRRYHIGVGMPRRRYETLGAYLSRSNYAHCAMWWTTWAHVCWSVDIVRRVHVSTDPVKQKRSAFAVSARTESGGPR